MYRAKVRITLRSSILDPQGKAVHHAIASLGMNEVKEVRMGKYVEMSVDCVTKEDAGKVTDNVCRKLLANPVMEDYSVEIEKL